ncbi:MAG: TonB family protein [Desulfuromonadaceae bacterium]|nr:TonB family protein [Desulfuromonadaceae bacterium]
MNDRYIEKSFLCLIIVSLLLHMGSLAALYYFSQSRHDSPKLPVFLDLQEMPELKPTPQPRQQETRRQADRRIRTPRETAPRGDSVRDSLSSITPSRPQSERSSSSAWPAAPQLPVAPGSSIASLLKPRSKSAEPSLQPQLFPSTRRLAKLEENYRRTFENDIAEGNTRILNSDDIQFGSFLRRFEGAVYGVWRYPREAAMKGIEGITPVRITFNRRGEIIKVQQLESSGARILDEEVLRTLGAIGPVGGFPKGYDKDEFHLIAFFQYGGSRRTLR